MNVIFNNNYYSIITTIQIITIIILNNRYGSKELLYYIWTNHKLCSFSCILMLPITQTPVISINHAFSLRVALKHSCSCLKWLIVRAWNWLWENHLSSNFLVLLIFTFAAGDDNRFLKLKIIISNERRNFDWITNDCKRL